MSVRQSFFSIASATLGLFLTPIAAHAIGLSTLSSEAELKALISRPKFVAEGQFGSIALTKDDETQGNVDVAWSNEETQPFSISYDGSTFRYTVGEKTLETQSNGFFKDIFIYTKAAGDSSSVVLNNLLLTDSNTTLSISGIAASYPQNELNIFWIHGIEESFTLTGNAILSWLNQLQNPTNLIYQIQVGNVDAPNTSPDTEQGEATPGQSPEPGPEIGGGIDWFAWFSNSNSPGYCAN